MCIEIPFKELHTVAVEAAVNASRTIMEYRKRGIHTQFKAGGSSKASQVVTEADIASQKIIVEALMPSINQFNFGFLGEESTDDLSRFSAAYFWVVDPLDGTLPFVESQSGFAVSIALVSQDGVPVIGVVVDPVTDDCYHGYTGSGVLKNGIPLTSSLYGANNIQQFTCFIDRSFANDSRYTETVAFLETVSRECECSGFDIVIGKGAVMNACGVIESPYACYIKLPKEQLGGGSIWDFAATAFLFKEGGKSITSMYGDDLDLNKKGSAFMNNQGVLYSSSKKISNAILQWFAENP